jgi:hypothetical protein
VFDTERNTITGIDTAVVRAHIVLWTQGNMTALVRVRIASIDRARVSIVALSSVPATRIAPIDRAFVRVITRPLQRHTCSGGRIAYANVTRVISSRAIQAIMHTPIDRVASVGGTIVEIIAPKGEVRNADASIILNAPIRCAHIPVVT